MNRFNPKEVALWSGGAWQDNRMPEAIAGFCFDARLIKPGECFVALSCGARDGHEFVPQAVDSESPDAVSWLPPGTERRFKSVSRTRLGAFIGATGIMLQHFFVTSRVISGRGPEQVAAQLQTGTETVMASLHRGDLFSRRRLLPQQPDLLLLQAGLGLQLPLLALQLLPQAINILAKIPSIIQKIIPVGYSIPVMPVPFRLNFGKTRETGQDHCAGGSKAQDFRLERHDLQFDHVYELKMYSDFGLPRETDTCHTFFPTSLTNSIESSFSLPQTTTAVR